MVWPYFVPFNKICFIIQLFCRKELLQGS